MFSCAKFAIVFLCLVFRSKTSSLEKNTIDCTVSVYSDLEMFPGFAFLSEYDSQKWRIHPSPISHLNGHQFASLSALQVPHELFQKAKVLLKKSIITDAPTTVYAKLMWSYSSFSSNKLSVMHGLMTLLMHQKSPHFFKEFADLSAIDFFFSEMVEHYFEMSAEGMQIMECLITDLQLKMSFIPTITTYNTLLKGYRIRKLFKMFEKTVNRLILNFHSINDETVFQLMTKYEICEESEKAEQLFLWTQNGKKSDPSFLQIADSPDLFMAYLKAVPNTKFDDIFVTLDFFLNYYSHITYRLKFRHLWAKEYAENGNGKTIFRKRLNFKNSQISQMSSFRKKGGNEALDTSLIPLYKDPNFFIFLGQTLITKEDFTSFEFLFNYLFDKYEQWNNILFDSYLIGCLHAIKSTNKKKLDPVQIRFKAENFFSVIERCKIRPSTETILLSLQVCRFYGIWDQFQEILQAVKENKFGIEAANDARIINENMLMYAYLDAPESADKFFAGLVLLQRKGLQMKSEQKKYFADICASYLKVYAWKKYDTLPAKKEAMIKVYERIAGSQFVSDDELYTEEWRTLWFSVFSAKSKKHIFS